MASGVTAASWGVAMRPTTIEPSATRATRTNGRRREPNTTERLRSELEEDLAHVLPVLDEPVRLGRLGEGEDLVHARPDHAFLVEVDQAVELGADELRPFGDMVHVDAEDRAVRAHELERLPARHL